MDAVSSPHKNIQVANLQRCWHACGSSREPESVPSTSGVSKIAACPPSPAAADPPALPSPTSCPSSNQDLLLPGHLIPAPLCQLLHWTTILFKALLLLSRFSRVRLCATPQTAAHQAPPSLGFSRQEPGSGLPFPSPMHESETWKWSRSVMSDSSRPHGLQPTRLLRPWDFPGKSTGVGRHCLLLQGSVL